MSGKKSKTNKDFAGAIKTLKKAMAADELAMKDVKGKALEAIACYELAEKMIEKCLKTVKPSVKKALMQKVVHARSRLPELEKLLPESLQKARAKTLAGGARIKEDMNAEKKKLAERLGDLKEDIDTAIGCGNEKEVEDVLNKIEKFPEWNLPTNALLQRHRALDEYLNTLRDDSAKQRELRAAFMKEALDKMTDAEVSDDTQRAKLEDAQAKTSSATDFVANLTSSPTKTSSADSSAASSQTGSDEAPEDAKAPAPAPEPTRQLQPAATPLAPAAPPAQAGAPAGSEDTARCFDALDQALDAQEEMLRKLFAVLDMQNPPSAKAAAGAGAVVGSEQAWDNLTAALDSHEQLVTQLHAQLTVQ